MKQFYYNYNRSDRLLTIFDSNYKSIAHINDVKPYENILFLTADTLYNMGYINMIENIDLLEV